jgi:O-antigen ligase
MHMLWIAALVSAFLGLFQWLKLEEFLGIFVVETDLGEPVMGNLAQPNQLGTLLLMGIVAYAYIYERHVIGKVVFVLGITVLTAILVQTHSRAAMLGVVAVSVFLLVKKTSTGGRLSVSLVIGWLALFGLMTLASPYVNQALLIDVQQEPLLAANGRIQIWSQTVEGIRVSPWVGYGWNQTFSATALGSLRYPGTLIATFAHNVLLDMIAWNGLPVGMVIIVLGGYWFLTRLIWVRGILGTYAMAVLLPFTIHSMVEYSFSYSYFLLASGVMIGVVEASLVGTKEAKVPRSVLGAALALWSIIGVGVIRDYMLLEEDVRVTAFENLRVGATDPAYQIPDIGLLTHMATLQRATRLRPVPDMSAQQLHDMRLAVQRFPTGGLALRYAVAQGLNEDPSGAAVTFAVIRGVYGPVYFSSVRTIWAEYTEKYGVLKSIDIELNPP